MLEGAYNPSAEEAETGQFQGLLASYSGRNGDPPGLARDLISRNKVENDGER